MNGPVVAERTHVRTLVGAKVGDKDGFKNPLKKNLALRDGLLFEWRAEGFTVAVDPTEREKRAYAWFEVNVPIADWPAVQGFLQGAMENKEVFKQGKPDVNKWRARKRLVTFSQVEQGLLLPGVEAAWRSRSQVVEPVKVEWANVLPLLKSSDTLNPAAADVNQISVGTFTIGPAIGDDYATWNAFYADLANLTGALIGNQTGDTTEVAGARITENLNGFAFTCTSDDWHHSNSTRGHVTTIAHLGNHLELRMEGPGTVNINLLRTRRTVNAFAVTNGSVTINEILVACTINISELIIDGGLVQGSGIEVGDATPTVNIWDCEIFNHTGVGAAGIIVPDVGGGINAASIMENNDCYNNDTGILLIAANDCGTYRRNALYANGTDIANHGNSTGDRNQSSDATAINAAWNVGTNNQINGVAGVDFDSVDDQHPKFLRPVDGGVLELAAGGVYLAANLTDCAGRPWATYGDWIGAKANPGPVAEPDWDDTTNYVRDSQYAIAYRKHFEGTHADTLNHPLVLTEAQMSAAQETFMFTTNPPAADGSDLVVVAHTAAGAAECATEVVGINLGAGTFTIWARYPDLDDEYGDVLADAVFSIQWSGLGPTDASTAVYDGNYAQNDDHHMFHHLEDAASGTAVDAAGHYDLTEGGTVVNAAAQVDDGSDLEAADTADTLNNAAAGNWERTQVWTTLLWFKKEQNGITEALIGRRNDAGNGEGWIIYAAATNTLRMLLANTAVNRMIAEFGTVNDANWHFLVVHYTGTGTVAGVTAELDGVILPIVNIQDALGANSILTTQLFCVGSEDAGTWWFDGIVDEARLVPDVQLALTVAEGRTHYNNEYSVGSNGVWDWGEETGTNPGEPPPPAPTVSVFRQRQYVFRMPSTGCRT